MNKTIAILGGAGYIGSHTSLALEEAGYTPIVIDNFSSGSKEGCGKYQVEQADILDTQKIAEIFAKYRPSAVIHFAALIEVGESIKYPGRFFQNNVEGTRSVLDAMVKANVRNIVFSSTAAVYGQPDTKLPLTEDLPLAPINPYGQTKLAAEWLIRSYDAAHGIKSMCLRYFNASGADLKGRIGETHYPETHLIPLVVQTALGMREKIFVFGTDYSTEDGTCVRDYIHVSDLANAHVRAAEYLANGGNTDYCNLGTGEGYSVNQIIETVTAVSRKNLNVERAARRPGDPAVLVADNTKARKILNWEPKLGLDDIVKSAHQWHETETYQKIWARKKAV